MHTRIRWNGLAAALLLSRFATGCGAVNGDASAQDSVSTATSSAGENEPGRANRLARETSPYLLLHSHNPVDWYPWGPEAFEKARRENKPVFLSVGYSSCYWCHVMERLVFENEDIAGYMNEHFINVKVDREERPDVDDIYMTSLHVYFQLIGSQQSGGWPLSMFLTPERKPIAGGTYFPPETKDGRTGFPDVMRRMSEVWNTQEAGVRRNADLITREIQRLMAPQLKLRPVELKPEFVQASVTAVIESYDAEHGGVGFDAASPNAPKFPTPVKLSLLQYAARRHDHRQAEQAVLHTLDAMAAGGIHDHLGGGFHRYSTDREWLVPHFEKMLYVQAQLLDVYVEAFRRTREERYRRVAEDIAGFVLRDMTGPGGGFYSALDAETDGVEGKYYVWSKDEVQQALGDDAALFMRAYGLAGPQEFEHGYVLHLPQSLEKLASELPLPVEELQTRLAAARARLLEVRRQRKPLLRDDKVLTSWNGLMIGALARAGQVLERPDYVAAAQTAALFVLSNLRTEEGHLLRTWRDGQAKLNAYLDDYAFLVDALLALRDATADDKWLNAARRLNDVQVELFRDKQAGGFFFTSHDHESLIARSKSGYESVVPAGNSVAVRNLLRLASLAGRDDDRQQARATLEAFVPDLERMPRSLTGLAVALGEFLDDPQVERGTRNVEGGTPNGDPQSADHGADNAARRSPFSAPRSALEPIVQVAAETKPPADKKPEIVTARAYLDVDKLPAGGTCRIVVYLKIQDGWHINQNPARPDNLIPTQLSIKSTQETKLSDVKYPAGAKLEVEGFDGPALVYEKRAVLHGVLTAAANPTAPHDDVEIRIRYQPCNDRQCLAPKTIKLSGRVPIAGPGEPVQAINGHLFPKRHDADSPPAAGHIDNKERATDGPRSGRPSAAR